VTRALHRLYVRPTADCAANCQDRARLARTTRGRGQGRSDGGILVYIPPKSVYLTNFYVVTDHDVYAVNSDACQIIASCRPGQSA